MRTDTESSDTALRLTGGSGVWTVRRGIWTESSEEILYIERGEKDYVHSNEEVSFVRNYYYDI